MATTLNLTSIITKVQTSVDTVTTSTSLDDILRITLAAHGASSNDVMLYVNTLDDLPNIVTTNFPAGIIVFVKSLDIPVISNATNWYGLDGQLIKTDGAVTWSWGRNNYGQLGDGTATDRSSPISVVGGFTWKQTQGGLQYTAAIKSDDTLWAWGRNNYGQLGNNNSANKSSPVSLVAPANGWAWKQVTTGHYHTAAIRSDGVLWTWGHNSVGQLGDGTAATKSSPVSLIAPANGWTWKQVANGNAYTVAIKSDDTLWSWGSNFYGQLGDNTAVSKSSPVSVIGGRTWKTLETGNSHAMAINSDGTLWAWGSNSFGGLGDNTAVSKSSPVSVVGGFAWKQVNGGALQTAAIRSNDTLWCWGYNNVGQLGDNTTTNRSSPVSVISGYTWKSVGISETLTAAIKSDNTLWTWGINQYGQLGDNNGTVSSRSSPVSVVGGFTWKQVSAGGYCIISLRPFSS